MHTTTTSIRIDGEPFLLADGQDVEALKARIVEAVTGGARFVEFDGVGRVHVAVLVTPRSVVHLEVHEREEEDLDGPLELPVDVDVDLYSYG
ncbi:hypothetical protein [Clavibacter zhangzhiyongii]|uniref:hypothetical protein n=1 Tax=Clavibacter zhangzhiyongii TaxID=2768071 RepID=UPI0039E091A0